MWPGKPPLTQLNSIYSWPSCTSRCSDPSETTSLISTPTTSPRALLQHTTQNLYLYTTPPPVRQALDIQTQAMAKDIFKLIKAIHHKQIIDNAITTGTFLSGMSRQVKRLTAFIKPSSPTDDFHKSVADNTHTWMTKNMTLLQSHYSSAIANHSNITATEAALTVAKGWANKRYGNRLHKDTFLTLASLTYPHCSSSQADATGSQPDPVSQMVDSGTRQLPKEAPDIRAESEFPRINRDMPPPPRSLYLGNRPTFIEQYPQIHPKQLKTNPVAPNPQPPTVASTNRPPNTFSTPLPPRRTGPIKNSATTTESPKLQTPIISPIGAGAPTPTEMQCTLNARPQSPFSLPSVAPSLSHCPFAIAL